MIRPSQPRDLIHLRVMFSAMVAEKQYIHPHYTPLDIDAFTIAAADQLTTPDPSAHWLVSTLPTPIPSDNDDPPVGFCIVEAHERQIGQPHLIGSLTWLYVMPPYRLDGRGRQLIQAAMSWLRGLTDPPIQMVELACLPTDLPFWQSMGATPQMVMLSALTDQLGQASSRDIPDAVAADSDGNGVAELEG